MKKARCRIAMRFLGSIVKVGCETEQELNSEKIKASLAKSAKIMNKGQMYSFQKKAESMQCIYHCHGFRC